MIIADPGGTSADRSADVYFFFSYARKDLTPYLGKFFTDLVQETRSLAGREEVSFRDLTNLEPGDSWPAEIENALRYARVLVAVYSPWYFKRAYCGKEVQVFLDRQLAQAGRGEKILPVFWSPKEWLARYRLPPESLGHVHFEHKDFPPEYLRDGLSIMAKNRRIAYSRLVNILARRIIALAEVDPLTPYPRSPKLATVQSAFDEAAARKPPEEAADGPRRVQFLFLAAHPAAEPLAAELAPSAPWKLDPFAGSGALDALIDSTLADAHDYQLAGAPADLREIVLDLRRNNALPILVFDHVAQMSPAWRDQLVEVLDDDRIDCGILITLDESAPSAASARTDLERALQFGRRDRAKQLEIVGTEKALREGLAKLLLGLRQRTVQAGRIHRIPEGDGPMEKPQVSAASMVG
jgi:hypothetical protein